MSDANTEIKNRIAKNLKNLVPWASKLNIDAYRIYERDIPEYPYIVDRYLDSFVVYDRGNELDLSESKAHHFPALLQALAELFEILEAQVAERVIVKQRNRQKGESQYDKISSTGKTMTVREGPARFLVNLYDYLDTGLFLDHRLMRQRVFKESSGRDVLNLFSYTGSVSVFAALGGARTTSVDMSATYTRWARENFLLNGIELSGHQFINENALEYLSLNVRLAKQKFDIIFLDPPTFSNSKKMQASFEVERDQESLIHDCLALLKPRGTLYFSNNKRNFRLLPDLIKNLNIKDITASTIPKDFRDQKIHRVFQIKPS